MSSVQKPEPKVWMAAGDHVTLAGRCRRFDLVPENKQNREIFLKTDEFQTGRW